MSEQATTVWYQIVKEDGSQMSSCTSVDVPSNCNIDKFRKLVNLENADGLLKTISPAELKVYRNKTAYDNKETPVKPSTAVAGFGLDDLVDKKDPFHGRSAAVDNGKEKPLEDDSFINGLGASKKEALIVAVQASDVYRLPSTSIAVNLQKLGVEFSPRDIKYLLSNDTAKYSLLKSPQLTQTEARAILTFAKSKIKSTTRKAIGKQHSYFLGGSLNVGQGQVKSSLYYAFSESGAVLAAKVYNRNKESFLREVEANKVLEHKNLVKFIKTFSIQNDERHVIIMPFFPRSVADWLAQDSELPLAAVKIIARSCFNALCHLHSKKLCFTDLKPSNVMLQNAELSYATLVDYGATVRIGNSVIEFSQAYCLDADTITATEHLDWICLGTTLARIGGFDITNFERAADLVDEVCSSTINNNLKNLIVSCLQSPSASKIESALDQLDNSE